MQIWGVGSCNNKLQISGGDAKSAFYSGGSGGGSGPEIPLIYREKHMSRQLKIDVTRLLEQLRIFIKKEIKGDDVYFHVKN